MSSKPFLNNLRAQAKKWCDQNYDQMMGWILSVAIIKVSFEGVLGCLTMDWADDTAEHPVGHREFDEEEGEMDAEAA